MDLLNNVYMKKTKKERNKTIIKYNLTGNGSLASWIMNPSITCVNIFGFLDFPDDLDTTAGFCSHFCSWFETANTLSLITVAGFDLSPDGFETTGDFLMRSCCAAVAVTVDKPSDVVTMDADTVVTTGTETELVIAGHAAVVELVVFGPDAAVAVTTAVSKLADDC